jgi:hypothetical protein
MSDQIIFFGLAVIVALIHALGLYFASKVRSEAPEMIPRLGKPLVLSRSPTFLFASNDPQFSQLSYATRAAVRTAQVLAAFFPVVLVAWLFRMLG